jgi:hypothetical protein
VANDAGAKRLKTTTYVARPGLAAKAEFPIYFFRSTPFDPCQEKSAEIL